MYEGLLYQEKTTNKINTWNMRVFFFSEKKITKMSEKDLENTYI